jgi:chromosome segregation ATPase
MEISWETKYLDAQKQIKLLEARMSDLNSQLSASDSEKGKLHHTINKQKEKIDSLLFSSKKIEKENASLQERFNDLEILCKRTDELRSSEGFRINIIFAHIGQIHQSL